jgi:peptidoglycan/LPS O-acetylase OafA/YrhL
LRVAFAWRTDSFDGPYLFQLPVFHLAVEGGKLAVGIFFILSGYVSSLKPLKLARVGRTDDGRKAIARSAFRRSIRLALPATLVTTISWLLFQLGAYNLAHSLPVGWLHGETPASCPDFVTSLKELFKAYVSSPGIHLSLFFFLT